MKKILIVGASSFVAIELIKKMLHKNYYIVAVIRPNSPNYFRIIPLKDQIRIIELEMSNYTELSGMIEEDFDLCYYFSWNGVRGKERDCELLQRGNYLAYESFTNSIKEKVKRFIGIGSWAEYGQSDLRMCEEIETNPMTWYGKYKQKCCMYGQEVAKSSHMEFVWARIFSLYGPGDYEGSLIMNLCKNMLRNENVDLSKCEHVWNYLYVTDAAELLFRLGVNTSVTGIYNIASAESRVLKDYILEIKKLTNSESNLNFGAVTSSNINMRPSLDKLQYAIGKISEVTFEDGIFKVIEIMHKEGKV